MRILIVSIFGPSPYNREWHRLQRQFIAATAGSADLGFQVFLNGVAAEELDGPTQIIGSFDENLGHTAALEAVVAAMRMLDHDYFLILDSDCFPIRFDWAHTLRAQMERFGKRIAAPIRYENLDAFPHPCAFFISRALIDDPRIDFSRARQDNLLGQPTRDVGAAMHCLLPEILPLLRSNLRNRHPVAAAVYQHLFYHHGAGSRSFSFRLINRYDYCGHWWSADDEARCKSTLMDELLADPEAFVRSLTDVEPTASGQLSSQMTACETG